MSHRSAAMALVVAVAISLAAALTPAAGAAGPRDLDVLVTDSRGIPLFEATIILGPQTVSTDHYGRARLTGVVAGSITVDHPRTPLSVVEWSGAGERLRVAIGAPVLRAIHVAGTLPGTARWAELLAFADRTALNAVMLDMKDESGRVFPHTSSPWALAAGANSDRWDFADVVTQLHARDLSVITRIVTFQDPIVGNALPHMAVQTSPGVPFTRRGLTFLDPTDLEARAYAIDLATEACRAGVDEVQFDYVRYPDGAGDGLLFDAGDDEASRVDNIVSFLEDARAALLPQCAIAADIFGFITSVPTDGGIGQQLEALAKVTEVLSPMAYPHHWSTGWFGYSIPADHPGGVIDASMRDAISRVGGSTTIRPWLQDFGGYGPLEVRAQIDAADALGLGWMVWNAGSVFTQTGFPTDAEVSTPAVLPPALEEFLPSSRFWDVADATTFSADVEWLGAHGITRGCNPPWRDDFCPRRTVTRAEAASLLVRALELPASAIDRFSDDDGSTHEKAIDALAATGITRGCSPTGFCPERSLSRAEMAALVARALALPAASGDTFIDDDASTHEADIERIAAAGITRGCGVSRFCPDQAVTREQAAAFFHRALG